MRYEEINDLCNRTEIKKSIVVDASPEVVFKAITDPNELTNWFPDHATQARWKNEVQLL
jgi:uncharacterized protein YndB with AHSA1/START domain